MIISVLFSTSGRFILQIAIGQDRHNFTLLQDQEVEYFDTDKLNEFQLECLKFAIPNHSIVNIDGTFVPLFDRHDVELLASLHKDEFSILRALRNLKLLESDWTQLTDAPLTQEKKDEWVKYRQQLRDLPTNTINPYLPMWPDKPV